MDDRETVGDNGAELFPVGQEGISLPSFTCKYKFKDNAPSAWWLLSSFEGNTTDWCMVDTFGGCSSMNANYLNIGVPICFRVGIPNS